MSNFVKLTPQCSEYMHNNSAIQHSINRKLKSLSYIDLTNEKCNFRKQSYIFQIWDFSFCNWKIALISITLTNLPFRVICVLHLHGCCDMLLFVCLFGIFAMQCLDNQRIAVL